jgi:predicted polyphosphate/ATP-dependent NAD kinase
VGIVANPASGRDIRRLVAGASVFGNADKAGMVLRALIGLGAVGVPRALMMPAADGLGSTLQRQLRGRARALPELEMLPHRLTGTAADTTRAVAAMCEAGAEAIIVLGGDGTHRVVAQACGDVPICALSTGTNNAFPEMREATVAGMAVGLAVTGRGGPHALRQEEALAIQGPDGTADLALVDVTATSERFVGARAVWHPDTLREVIVTMADPAAVGPSALAGLLAPFERGSGRGLHVRLARSPGDGRLVLNVPLAPGLVAPVAVAGFRSLELGDTVALSSEGSLALDGEREIELPRGATARVRLVPGPARIDIDAVMRHHAAAHATWVQPVAG